MTRILLHLGFHKCATSSAQAFLHENRERIWPTCALALPYRLRPIANKVFWYRFERDEAALADLQASMRAFIRDLNLTPNRNLILSSENLLGQMPLGTLDEPYPIAVPVVRALTSAFEAIAWPCELTVYFSTRAHDDWVRSVWGHQARKRRNVRITDDLETFRARLSKVSLHDQLARIRAALPDLHIVSEDIDALAGAPFGVAQPFVDFLRLPPAKLAEFTPPPRANQGPGLALAEQLIELNRSDLDPDALHAAKDALIGAHFGSAQELDDDEEEQVSR
jgi:hypothetical protein